MTAIKPSEEMCDHPPYGWWCSRTPGHEGPCAAREIGQPWEGPLTSLEQGMLDKAWERHKAAGPVKDGPSDVVERLKAYAPSVVHDPARAAMRAAIATIEAQREALIEAEDDARRFALFHKQGSDARNTLVILADKIAALTAPAQAQQEDTNDAS